MDMHIPFPCLIVTNFSCKDSYGFETATWELPGSNFFFELKITSLSSFNKNTEKLEKNSGSELLGLQNLSMPLLNLFLKFNKQKIDIFQLGLFWKKKKLTFFMFLPPPDAMSLS